MINKRLAIGIVAALSAAACNGDITNANQNPNDPTDAPSAALFTNATRLGTSRWLGNFDVRGWELLAQHFAEVQYPETDQYKRLRASSTSGNFNGAYNGELQDQQLIIRRGLTANQPGLYGPAMVMKAWEFGILTDAWGDIPYSQAFKADSNILTPEYDPQQVVYDSLFNLLDKAATDMEGASNQLGSADPIYGGDPAQWQKFANSLHARHALRISYVDQARASAELQAAFTAPGGLITDNADNAALPWPGDGVYDNPWAANFQTRDDHRISTRLMTYLSNYNDPRTPVFAMPAEADTTSSVILKYCPSAGTCYVGLDNALKQDEAAKLASYTSRPSELFYPGQTAYGTFGGGGRAFPSFLMTAAEVLFIQAEAAERGLGGLTPAQAGAFYNAAITASMNQWGVTSATTIATYLAQPSVSYAAATTPFERLKRIAIQKWIALYSDGMQAWTEFRRTCQPSILKPGPEAINDQIPLRLQYSTTERAVNAENVAAAVARQGEDSFNTPLWWDETPLTAEGTCGAR